MELIKNISFKTLIPFVIAFIAILTFHFSIDVTTDDYKYFRIFAFGYYEEGDVFSFLQWRYATWTSRLLIEFFTFWFVQFPTWVYAIVDSVIVFAIVVMTYLLFSQKKGVLYATVAILLTFMYRITDQGSAGYLVTTIVYLWPLVAFIPTLFPFKNSLDGDSNRSLFWYILCPICALFCCNCEQICVASIMTWSMFILYNYIQSKKIDKLYCILLLIALAELAFIFTCPGNTARSNTEVSGMPLFAQYSFIRKVAYCVASPIAKYMIFSLQSIIVWAFSIILPFTLYLKYKKTDIPFAISMIPLVLLCSTLIKQFPVFTIMHLTTAKELLTICGTSAAFYGSILFTLFYIGKDENTLIAKYGPLYIFFVGLTTRACLGVTMSFVELARTFFLLEYAMIAISIIYLTKQISACKDKSETENFN